MCIIRVGPTSLGPIRHGKYLGSARSPELPQIKKNFEKLKLNFERISRLAKMKNQLEQEKI